VSLALGVLWAATASAATDRRPIAVLDLRPVGAAAETDLDNLGEATALSQALREAAARFTGRRVLAPEELRANLGARFRVQAFRCEESLDCLRPLMQRLARLKVYRVVVGTMGPARGGTRVRLKAVQLRPYEVAGELALTLRSERDAASQLTELGDLFGVAAPPPPEPETASPESPPEPAGPVEPPAKPAEVVDDNGDVVQTIGQTAAPTEAPAPDRFSMSGWARGSMEIDGTGQSQYATRPDPFAVPHDALIARGQLLIRARYSRGRWFEAAAEGLLDWGQFEQNPSSPDTGFDGFNGQSSRGTLEATARDLYLAFFWSKVDLRVGQQRVPWGRSDFGSPNDVLNAHDLRDPVLAEPELLHLPTPMARADIDLGVGVLEGVWTPFFVPDRVDLYGSNWAAVQPEASAPLRALLGVADRFVTPNNQDAFELLVQRISAPQPGFENSSGGARFSWSSHDVDVSHYYHYGFDTMPLYVIDPRVAGIVQGIDFSRAQSASLLPFLQAADAGENLFNVTYVRRHHLGTDAATTVGPFVLRLDAAYDSKRVFVQRDSNGAAYPTFEAVAALEYQTGEIGKSVLVEARWLHLFDAPAQPLFFYSQDNVGLSAQARWTFGEYLEAELRAVLQGPPASIILRPQLGLRFNPFVWRVGVVWLDGEDFSLGGYYRRNRSVYTMLKYSF
jgi:hypothetical protein